jgi:hypothetical protein
MVSLGAKHKALSFEIVQTYFSLISSYVLRSAGVQYPYQTSHRTHTFDIVNRHQTNDKILYQDMKPRVPANWYDDSIPIS